MASDNIGTSVDIIEKQYGHVKPLQVHKELTASQDRSSGVNQGYSILFFTTEYKIGFAPSRFIRSGLEMKSRCIRLMVLR